MLISNVCLVSMAYLQMSPPSGRRHDKGSPPPLMAALVILTNPPAGGEEGSACFPVVQVTLISAFPTVIGNPPFGG